MIEAIGPTLVCSAITNKPELRRQLIDAVHIDRLNLGPVPTIQLNWLQPHEGNIVDFLFRARAFQSGLQRGPILRGERPSEILSSDWASRRTSMRILSFTGGAGSMYCGSCLRDNALAAELLSRGHDVRADAGLYADAHRRAQRQPATTCSSAASACSSNSTPPLFRHTPRFLDRLWDRRLGASAGHEASDQGRSEEPRRADGVDAARASAASSARRS